MSEPITNFFAKNSELLLGGLGGSMFMTLLPTLLAYVIGMPLGIVLVLTQPGGLRPMGTLNRVLNVVVNFLRSLPFLILLIIVQPLTRLISGTTIGSTGMIVPLTVAAFPFVARMVEGSLNEVDKGIIEAMQSMGASTGQIAFRAMVPEAMPSLVTNATTVTTTILGYSAMAGIVGGGGLGEIAIQYGFYRVDPGLMWTAVIMLIVVVQLIQFIGNRIASGIDRRKS